MHGAARHTSRLGQSYCPSTKVAGGRAQAHAALGGAHLGRQEAGVLGGACLWAATVNLAACAQHVVSLHVVVRHTARAPALVLLNQHLLTGIQGCPRIGPPRQLSCSCMPAAYMLLYVTMDYVHIQAQVQWLTQECMHDSREHARACTVHEDVGDGRRCTWAAMTPRSTQVPCPVCPGSAQGVVEPVCVRMALAGVCKAPGPLSQTLPLSLTQPAHRTCRVYSHNEVRSLPSSLTPFVNTMFTTWLHVVKQQVADSWVSRRC